ncbi:MAG: OmpA family protein [Aestuariivita sp.]|nr:OmpA family protein [Aestuariivita sp.]
MSRWFLTLLMVAMSKGVFAFDFISPTESRLLAEQEQALIRYNLPIGPWTEVEVPTEPLEGTVVSRSWVITDRSITTLQVFRPLFDQIVENGFEPIFECEASLCGGFDFRFAISVLPAPDMYVNIRDYNFGAARKGEEAITLLVSRSRGMVYVQITGIGVSSVENINVFNLIEQSTIPKNDVQTLEASLIQSGHAVLLDLSFASGTAELSVGTYDSLVELARFMHKYPSAKIVLVGHTDFEGALDLNVELSKRRAGATRERLISEYGVAADRISINGIGYLSPVASNLTQSGRDTNRRVEVVLQLLD